LGTAANMENLGAVREDSMSDSQNNPITPEITAYVEAAMQRLRNEFTVMPRFGYHQPLDYHVTTFPPSFDPPIAYPGDPLPLPPVAERMGYSPEDKLYLEWGLYDHDLILSRIDVHAPGRKDGARILDFGCSSGRVLRHFHREHEELGWKLLGVDIQARPIEWMRQHFPSYFEVFVGTALPHLPLEDNSVDYIFGFSVFTHVKFLWDNWLLELRRVLKPGGLLLQTIQAETAWRYYYEHRDEEFIRIGQPEVVRSNPEMNQAFLYHGDIGVSQVFWKRETAREYWGRYLQVLEVYEPAEQYSFQDMIVCKKGPV
jgi:SAM-dependent methyltransferase